MKVLLISSSPKKNGITATIAGEILKSAEKNGSTCRELHLCDLKIADCLSCFKCYQDAKCFIRDDISIIEDAILESDYIIWASPTHWANMSAPMLRIFERLMGYFLEQQNVGAPKPRKAFGKKAILVTSCNAPWPINWLFGQSSGCIGRMKEVMNMSGQKVIATMALPGARDMKQVPESYILKARRIGSSIK